MEKEIRKIPGLGIETAFVYDFASHGELFLADAVNCCTQALEMDECSMLLSGEKEQFDNLMQMTNGAVVCFANNQSVISSYQIKSGKWNNIQTHVTELPDFDSVCVIYAVTGDVFSDRVLRAFQKGDVVRFKIGIDYVGIDELQKKILENRDTLSPMLFLDGGEYATVKTEYYRISGEVQLGNGGTEYELLLVCSDGRTKQEKRVVSLKNTRFSHEVLLNPGANYIEIYLIEDGHILEKSKKNRIVFYKRQEGYKQVIMWVEQYVNAQITNTVEKLEELTDIAKDAGITAFAVDLKGVEGYCSYKKATRTGVAYMDCSVNPKKKIVMEIDFLEEFVRIAHKKGMHVYGSFNFFVEGNIASNDYAINLPVNHPDWAEVLYSPESHGQCRSVLELDKGSMLCYVNPANEDVCSFELERVREVLDNYEIDGIIMDRTRYDNQYADFSDISRARFERYLAQKGKRLEHWPEDVYTFEQEKNMVWGPLYKEWLAFRSNMVREFAAKLRKVVEEYQKQQNRNIVLAAYVGAWYDLYYQNGVNWASEDFVYQEMLKFPVPELYTEEYAQTSYLKYIDFLMIGCYYDQVSMIEKYVTIGNIVTNQKVPVIASLSLPHLDSEKKLCSATEACVELSDGVMFFDLCYTLWEKLSEALKCVR